MRGSSLFASLSPGTTGALDLYEVAGGYATTNNNGISLGLLGGMEPGGAPRDRCGPAATEPTTGAIPQSSFFQGNTRPDNGAAVRRRDRPAQVAARAVRVRRLRRRPAVPDDRPARRSRSCRPTRSALLSRSLGKLVETNSPMAVGLRPQSPPTITLGKNTFTTDGSGNTTLERAAARHQVHGDGDRLLRDGRSSSTSACSPSSPTSTCRSACRSARWASSRRCSATSTTRSRTSRSRTARRSPRRRIELAMLFPNLLGLVLPQLSGGLPAISVPVDRRPQPRGHRHHRGRRQGRRRPARLPRDLREPRAPRWRARSTTTASRVPSPRRVAGSAVEATSRRARSRSEPRRRCTRPRVSATASTTATWSAWSTNRRPTASSRALFELPGIHTSTCARAR